MPTPSQTPASARPEAAQDEANNRLHSERIAEAYRDMRNLESEYRSLKSAYEDTVLALQLARQHYAQCIDDRDNNLNPEASR